MDHQTFGTTMSEGRGEGKHSCDTDCVSIPSNGEICEHFWFVLTSFVQGCSVQSSFSFPEVFCSREFGHFYHLDITIRTVSVYYHYKDCKCILPLQQGFQRLLH